ncbi:hypothetical protein HOLleu_43643 [Holothuria leucospilota]|uniref:Uncharacterized protein n=1 Tax=Holothuria leucospilota TaxID=206669 RepID=A0A9Q0Y9F5_HOLLE|nr:hypothetical protein HOLleu_43643 [Holothuria leucospilota]
MAPRTRFAVFSREWRALSLDDKAKYNRLAKTSMDLKKRKRKWQKTFTKICKSINTLQSLIPGTEAVFLLSVNKSIPTCAGTNRGVEFIEGEEGAENCSKNSTLL